MGPDDEERLQPRRLPDTETEFPSQHQIPERHHRHANQLSAHPRPQRQVDFASDEPRPPRLQPGVEPRRLLRLCRRLHDNSVDGQGHFPRRGAFRRASCRKNRQSGHSAAICLSRTLRLHAHCGAPVCRQEQIHTLGRIPGLVRLADSPQRHECAPRVGNSHRRRCHPHGKFRLYRRLLDGYRNNYQPVDYRLGAEHLGYARKPVALFHAAKDPARPRHAI